MERLCRIELLGGLRVSRLGRITSRFRTQKMGALLAYLAYHPQRDHPRAVLIEILWPECDVERARHNFNVALSRLRDELEEPESSSVPLFTTNRFAVGLNPALFTTDVAEFEQSLQAAESHDPAQRVEALTRAADLYQGSLLPGYYDEWILPEQRRLEERFLRVVHQLVVGLERNGDYDRALHYAHRAVSVDPLRESSQHDLIRLYDTTGQAATALRQYDEWKRALRQELNASPGEEIRELAARLRIQVTAGHGRSASVLLSGVGLLADPAPDTAPPPSSIPFPTARLEPVGGAVPLDSAFYVVRPTDDEFRTAIARQDSIVLVKGPRQVGKTSPLARGLQDARQAGAHVILTDLDVLNAAHLQSAETVLLALARSIVEQLDLKVSSQEFWDADRGPNPNFRRFMRREILGTIPTAVVWGLDEVDRLFACPFGSEIFALFRSWHNERALDPTGPWSRLTLAMAYATEAHLFITDLNKSPFNVGTRLELSDFSRDQVADLNRRYGCPLHGQEELDRYYHQLGGHPYLVRLGLFEMAARDIDMDALDARADRPDWIFGDHLQRLQAALQRDAEIHDVFRGVLQGRPCPTLESFYRLRSAGLVAGASEHQARPRCQLYARYLDHSPR